MGKSIMQTDRACFICGRLDGLERHHVLGGFSSNNRRLSETYGLWVYVCKKHHTDPKEGVQYNKEMNLQLKQDAQLSKVLWAFAVDAVVQEKLSWRLGERR